MPVIAQWILGGLAWALTSALGRIMATLGLSFVMVTFVMPDWLALISQGFSGAPAFVIAMAAFYRVDDAITIVLSAIALKVGTGLVKGFRRNAAGAGVGL